MIELKKMIVHNEALARLYGVKKDGEIDVEFKDGIARNREWRNRIRDSKIDGCVSFAGVDNESESPKKEKK